MRKAALHERYTGQRGVAMLEWTIVIVLVAVIAIASVKTFGREANLANCKVGLGLEGTVNPNDVYNGNHYFYDEETGESHCSRHWDGSGGPEAFLW
jgi:Flp pilus assembly pilin Flp